MATEIIMPKLGLTMTEGTIVSWLKRDGDAVDKGEPVLEILTDKANMEVESPGTGFLRITREEGAVVPILEVIGYVLAAGEAAAAHTETPSPSAQVSESTARPAAAENQAAAMASATVAGVNPGVRLRISPAARRVAKELGLGEAQLRTIAGTGPGGRVIVIDVRGLAVQAPTGAAVGPKPMTAAASAVPVAGETIPIKGVRALIAERMTRSVREAPQFHVTVDIGMDKMAQLREECLARLEAYGVRLSFTEMLAKVVSTALAEFPLLNAYVSDHEITLMPQVNIGVAVHSDHGLVVPVLRDVAAKSLFEVCLEQKQLIKKVREGLLSPDDLTGGTFTLSNMGMFHVDSFAAIVNPPQSAILAVGRMREVLVLEERSITARRVATFTVTCDHRAVDGVLAAKFLGRLKEIMESDEVRRVCAI